MDKSQRGVSSVMTGAMFAFSLRTIARNTGGSNVDSDRLNANQGPQYIPPTTAEQTMAISSNTFNIMIVLFN